MMSAFDFSDEDTPLPRVPGVQADPEFPTGEIPRIELGKPGDDGSGAASLYPRWHAESACANAAELVDVFTPHLDGTSLWLFPDATLASAERVALEIITRDGDRALAGIADVVETRGSGPLGRPAIRVRFSSIDLSSSPRVLAMTSSGATLRAVTAPDHKETVRMFALPGQPQGAKATQLMFKLPRNDHTTKMSRLELANMMGATFDELQGWDPRLQCTIRVIPATGEMVEVASVPDDLPAPVGPTTTRRASGPTAPPIPPVATSLSTHQLDLEDLRPPRNPWLRIAVGIAASLVAIEILWVLLR
ncbi:MAG TPA: hypothetical protein VML75_22130 [Kofleriaceae bacterium]|nr:hypothetical protein [Kofleriaceae bacterium]